MASTYGGYNQSNMGHNPTYGGTKYTSTTYGAQGGADGGGFMEGSQGGSQPGKRQTWDKDTLRPVTARQILEAEDLHQSGEARLDDADLTRVCVVGEIRNISRQTTNTTFRIDDGTGVVEAKDWNDVDAPTHDESGNQLPGARAAFEVGHWIKVWGNLKFVESRRHVGVAMMREIKDKNEVNYHLLEATYVHLYFTRGPPEALNGGEGGAGANDGQMQGVQGGGANGANSGTTRRIQGVSAAAQKVYQFLSTAPMSNEGLSLHYIAQGVKMPMQEVASAAHELEGISCIYTTVDDETWAILPE